MASHKLRYGAHDWPSHALFLALALQHADLMQVCVYGMHGDTMWVWECVVHIWVCENLVSEASEDSLHVWTTLKQELAETTTLGGPSRSWHCIWVQPAC